MTDIKIKAITHPLEAEKLESIQKLTWNMPESEVIPGRTMHALQFTGSCLLGAYDGSLCVGFIFGVLGTVQDLHNRIDQIAAARLQMYSVTMGVLPDYQHRGIGYQLKIAQREFALRIGVRLITWTFDPLESRNGYFNIRKLGVISHKYLEDFHGPMTGINQGLPSDRLYAEWWVTSNRVQARVDSSRGPLTLAAYIGGGAQIVNEASHDHKLLEPAPSFTMADQRMILIEIPGRFQAIKQADMDLAFAWRMHIREVAHAYFEKGYLITDFIRHQESEKIERSYYVLTSSDQEKLGPNV